MKDNILSTGIDFLSENWLLILTKGISAFFVFFLLYFLIKILTKKIKTKISENSIENDVYNQKVWNLVSRVVFVILMIFNFLIIFQIVGFNVWLLIGWLSLAFWFAMENTIWNMIAGILILTHKKIKIWQTIKLLWKFNVFGTIEAINMRYSIIRLIDKRRLLIPSMTMSSTPIQTIQDNPLIRWDIKIKVHRDNGIEVVKKLIEQAINEQEWVNFKWLTSVFMSNFDINGYVFKWVYFIERKVWKNSFILNKKILPRIIELFRKYGIKFTYPNMVLELES